MKDKALTVDASPFARALKIAGIYMAIAGVYIVVSDYIVYALVSDTKTMANVENFKGMTFIAVTGALLFVLLYYYEKERRLLEMQLLQNDRRNVMALCNATVAHDINNFLMGLMGLVEALKDREQGDEFLSTMRNEVEMAIPKLTQLSKSLVRGEREKFSCEAVDILKQVTTTATLLRKHPDVKKCRLTVDSVASASLTTNVALFEQALMNLIINSAQATPKGGQIKIRSHQDNGKIIIEVHDDGPGIPPDEAAKIFRAGYTTKSNGSGLGMLSVRAFAASCNGGVSVGQSHLGGAVVRIHIPVTEESSNKPTGGDA